MNRQAYQPEKLFSAGQDSVHYTKISPITGKRYNSGEYGGKLNTKTKVPFLTFPALEKIPFLVHGFSTRLGGFSRGDFNALNLSYSRGDDEKTVTQNYMEICDSIGLCSDDLVFSDQVHKTNIHLVTEKDRGKGIKYKRELEEIDGLITDRKNIPLVTFYADCVPLFFVDVKKKAIGLSHSGWRGTVLKMGEKTVHAMEKHFGSRRKDIICVIGPSICAKCYEVSTEVYSEFARIFGEKDLQEIFETKPDGKYQLDLWSANKKILSGAGIPEENISVSEICTCCNSSLLFSHRASGGKRGNLAGFLSIKE